MMTALTAAKRIDHLNKISKNQERYSVPHNQISKFSTNSRSQEDRLQREIAQHAADKVINNQLLHKDHKALHLQMEKEIELQHKQDEAIAVNHETVMEQRSTLILQCQTDRREHLLETSTMNDLYQRNVAGQAAMFEHQLRTLQERSLTDSLATDHSLEVSFSNYEHDPAQALKLFWENSAILRFQHDLPSNELLNEIRNSKISDTTKQSCLHDFKQEMDPQHLELSTCGVCYTSTFDDNKMVSLDNLSLLLLSPDKYLEIIKSPLKAITTSFWKDTNRNLGYYIHPSLVNDNKVPVCRQCLDSLAKRSLPKYCLANGYDLGNYTAFNLQPLTDAEKISISLYRPFGKVIKLLPVNGLGPDSQQTALRGHIIHFPLDGPNVLCHELPRRDLFSSIQVMFIGTMEQYLASSDLLNTR
jgi:hypothetical protein